MPSTHRPALLRDATTADLPGILAIYNDVIANSTAVYALQPSSLEERAAWFETRRAAGFPVLVAVRPQDDADAESNVMAFASFGEFRGAWPGYRHSVEHSVHVRADCRGQGLGQRLIQALLVRARAMDKHVMLGGVDAANLASLRLHQRLGFEQVAHFREVGHKFGRWLDLVFVQRWVQAGDIPQMR